MWRGALLGAVITLALMGVGMFWYQGRAAVERGAPLPDLAPVEAEEPEAPLLPEAALTDMVGPELPEATELTREQRRFFRYDRDRNWRISRTEMLSTRSDAFRKLDVDGNNLLDFEEWAVATVKKFDGADANANGELTPAEFATTKPKPKARPSCRC